MQVLIVASTTVVKPGRNLTYSEVTFLLAQRKSRRQMECACYYPTIRVKNGSWGDISPGRSIADWLGGYNPSLKMTSTQTKMTSTQTLPSDFMTAEPTQDTTPPENTSPIDSGRLRAQLEESLKLAKTAVRVAAENRGQDILCLDLSEQTSLFDYFVIATGASRRQLSAMATEIDRAMKTEFNERKLSVSGLEESRWIVLDYGSIVVHLFDEETREFYDLESLWGDARQVGVSEVVAAATTQMARINTIENPTDPA